MPFDRIDRGLIDAILDAYFETERTAAIHVLEDEKEHARRNALGIGGNPHISPRETKPIVLDKDGNDITPKNIYDFAGEGDKMRNFKAFQEMEKKYGGEPNAE